MENDGRRRPLAKVVLRRVDEVRATAILNRSPVTGDEWASGYPTEGDVEAAGLALRSMAVVAESAFCCYEILDGNGLTVGGAGFHSPPRPDGSVEIGYGVAPSVWNRGFATAAVAALVDLARGNGASSIVARTDPENRPSQRALERATFTCDSVDNDYAYYSLDLEPLSGIDERPEGT